MVQCYIKMNYEDSWFSVAYIWKGIFFCVLWFMSVIFSGRLLSIHLLWISLYEFELHVTIWKTGCGVCLCMNIWPAIRHYLSKVQLNTSIINLSQNSADVFTRWNLQITLFSRNPHCACIKGKRVSWKWPKTSCEGNAVLRMKMKSSKQTSRHLISVSLYHLSPIFPYLKVLMSS